MRYLLLLLLLACGGDDMKKVEELGGFRILGVITQTPEVTPGASVTDLQMIFSDVNSGGRSITGSATGCIDPGISLGAKVSCDHDPGRVTQAVTIDTLTDDATNGFFTGVTPAFGSFTVPATIFLGRNLRDQFNGVGYLILFDFTVDGKKVQTLKRIVATNRGTLNTNPSGSSMLLNGSPVLSSPAKNDKLSVTNNSLETYDTINVDGSTETRTEKLQVAWYLSKGEIDKPKSFVAEDVKYLDPKVPGAYLQIAVLRDDRGGIEVLLFNQ